MVIAVMDGQGAGLGQSVIKKIRKELGDTPKIFSLGTNSTAAHNMVKAGADSCLWGEKAIVDFLETEHLDCIIGPIGIMCSGGINGEITSPISNAVLHLDSIKYILPLQVHGIYIPGTRNLDIKDIIDEIVSHIKGLV